jgi:hypothetical protein
MNLPSTKWTFVCLTVMSNIILINLCLTYDIKLQIEPINITIFLFYSNISENNLAATKWSFRPTEWTFALQIMV